MTHDTPTHDQNPKTTILAYEYDNDYIYAIIKHRAPPMAPTHSTFRNRILSRIEIEQSANVMFTNNHWAKIAASITIQLNEITNPTPIHRDPDYTPTGSPTGSPTGRHPLSGSPEFKNQPPKPPKPYLPDDTYINSTIAKSMLNRPEPKINYYLDPYRETRDEYIYRAYRECPYRLSTRQKGIYTAHLGNHYDHRKHMNNKDLNNYKDFLKNFKHIDPHKYPYASLTPDHITLQLHPVKPKLTNNGYFSLDTIHIPIGVLTPELSSRLLNSELHHRDTLMYRHTLEQSKPGQIEDLA